MTRSFSSPMHLDGALVLGQRVVEGDLLVARALAPRRARRAARMSLASSISSWIISTVEIALAW